MISKLVCIAALFTLLALLACGGGDTTETPADTRSSQPTEAPTATPRPTPTPTPEPTATPEPTPPEVPEPTAPPDSGSATPGTGQSTEMGPIAPLHLNDPLAVASELSETELVCLAGVADMARLMETFAAPELATPEEQAKFIGCFEDETLLRLFLTGFIEGPDPLSVETSACIRTGMEGVDLRQVMLPPPAGDEQTAMVGSMSAFILTLMCLNDEEWEAAAGKLGAAPEERENLQCVLDKLGGPEGFAETLAPGDEGSFLALFGAAMGCGVPMPGGPAPGG